MGFEDTIAIHQRMIHEYAKDLYVLEELQRAWPEGIVEPDLLSFPYGLHVATLRFVAWNPADGRELISTLLSAFKTEFPGFKRDEPTLGGQVSASATSELAGFAIKLEINDVGTAPNCTLVAEEVTVPEHKETKWRIDCEPESEED